MTRLTNLHLWDVRGENPEPIPFPTQFCNMIYLRKFTSRFNNFSGFLRRMKSFISFCILIGQIPISLTNLVRLESFYLSFETLMEGLIRNFYFTCILLIKIGEFPLAVGSFQNLTSYSFSHRISS